MRRHFVDDGITDNAPALRELIAHRTARREHDSSADGHRDIALIDQHVIIQSGAAPAAGPSYSQHDRLAAWTAIRRFWRRLKGTGA